MEISTCRSVEAGFSYDQWTMHVLANVSAWANFSCCFIHLSPYNSFYNIKWVGSKNYMEIKARKRKEEGV